MSFERLFDNPIPVAEAARFYQGLVKKAEWTDPPDLSGELEGMFTVPIEQVVAKLREVITAKYRKMVAYYTYAQSINDMAWRALKIEFYEHASDEQEGAEYYTKRAVVLGGPVHMDPIEPPPASVNPIGILKLMVRAEQEGIALQRELRQLVGDENPMKVGIEEHMLKDQHHLDELWQMLPRELHQELEMQMEGATEPAPEGMSAAPAGMEGTPAEEEVESEEPEEELDDDEKAAALRMTKAAMAVNPAAALAGGLAGLSAGRNLAGNTAAVAPAGRVTRSDQTARQLAYLGAPAGAVGGLLAAQKYNLGPALIAAANKAGIHGMDSVIGLATPAAAALAGGAAGGALTGLGVGGVQALRGSPPGYGKNTKAERAKKKEAADKTDAELKEVGRQRGVANLAAEATREKGRRGERVGKTLGMIGGAAGGAALGNKLVGGPMGTLGGTAIGALMGRSAGNELGTEYDIAKNAAAMRFSLALHKLAEEPGMPGGGDAGDGISSPTAPELQPQNYLAAEMLGQQAQDANEAAFYREQLGAANQSMTAMQQQMADVQARLDQMQQQADQSGMQIEQAAQEAMAARDDAVNATMEVAKARIGAQKLRQAMLDVASQDPQALGEEEFAPQPMMGPDGMPMDPAMSPDGMPVEEGPAGAAPAAQGMAPEAPPQPQGPEVMPKTGSALLGAGAGAVLGAGGSLLSGRQVPALRQQVQQLEGSQDGGFRQAAALAAAKGGLAAAELAEAHPVRSAISGGIGGALTGAAMGPALVSGVRELATRHIPAVARRVMGG